MAKRLLVIKDESRLQKEILAALPASSYEWRVATDGVRGLEEAVAWAPDVIVLGLMVQGMHGYELLRRLKEDDRTRAVPVVVVSSRPYGVDQRRALVMGGARFLVEPATAGDLFAMIARVLDGTKVTFWGVRGSCPTPGAATQRYGGNTPCVTIEHRGALVILDGGTGLRSLGERLCAERAGEPLCLSILLSHAHWDHIQGIPFFRPLYDRLNAVDFYGPVPHDRSFRSVLEAQMDGPFFPVAFDEAGAHLTAKELRGEPIRMGPFDITYTYLNHPGVTLGYRVEVGGRAIVYAPDSEPYPVVHATDLEADHPALECERASDERLVRLLADADLAIMDSQYGPADYEKKRRWGHSCYLNTVEICAESGAASLALFSHDPSHGDELVDAKERECRARVRERGHDLEVFAAAEGMVLEF